MSKKIYSEETMTAMVKERDYWIERADTHSKALTAAKDMIEALEGDIELLKAQRDEARSQIKVMEFQRK